MVSVIRELLRLRKSKLRYTQKINKDHHNKCNGPCFISNDYILYQRFLLSLIFLLITSPTGIPSILHSNHDMMSRYKNARRSNWSFSIFSKSFLRNINSFLRSTSSILGMRRTKERISVRTLSSCLILDKYLKVDFIWWFTRRVLPNSKCAIRFRILAKHWMSSLNFG